MQGLKIEIMYQYEHQNIVNVISEIETNFPVHNLIFHGNKIWPVLKTNFNLQMLLNNSESIAKSEVAQKKFKQKIGDIILAYRNFKHTKAQYKKELNEFKLKTNIPQNSEYVFITFSSFRTKKINNIFYDTQVDPFFSTVINSANFHVIEFSFDKASNQNSLSPSYNANALKARAEVNLKKNKIKHYIFDLVGYNQNKKLKQLISDLQNFIKEKNYSISINYEYVFEQLDSIILLKNEFIKFYKKLKPKFVLTPSYFNHESFASTLACNELGIKTIEIQHGVYGQPIYKYYGTAPKNGYEMLPDYFFSWDQDQAHLINSWANKTNKHKALVYGLNALTFWQKNKDSFINDDFEQLLPILNQEEKTKILFTISDLIDEKLPLLIKRTENTCFWFIRNHPRTKNAPFIADFEKKMKELGCGNYEINHSTNAPLYSLLWKMDYHITMISSVVCEASSIGLPSLVISESGRQLFHEFYEKNPLVIFTTNSDEIFKKINEKRTNKNQLSADSNNKFENFIKSI